MKKSTTIKCAKCNTNERAQGGKQRWCLPCRNIWSRNKRKKYSSLGKIAKKKNKARSYLNVYIKRGKIIRKLCIKCGKKAQGHHPDYDNPLKVIWLCKKHHHEIHQTSRDN